MSLTVYLHLFIKFIFNLLLYKYFLGYYYMQDIRKMSITKPENKFCKISLKITIILQYIYKLHEWGIT